MITTLVGKTFLKAYNEKYKKDYSAKAFFEKEYFELFFNHPKYMQWITNSPFVQGITTDDNGCYGKEIAKLKIGNAKDFEKELNQFISDFGVERISTKTEKSKGTIKIILKNDVHQRLERLHKFHSNIESGARDGSIAIGYPASEENGYGTYSGLVSDMQIDTNEEDVYCSWIGSALGIGIAGAYNILINDNEINLELFEGWKHYRNFLNNETLDKLKGNQINTWNGQWLTFRLGKRYIENFEFSTLEDEKVFKIDGALIQVETVNWSNLFFSLSHTFPERKLNSYVYSIGDKNNTIGFIPIYLKAGRTLKDVYRQLFQIEQPFNNKDFQSLFGMHIKRACELGNIGLHALRPEGLKKYVEEDKNLSFKKDEDTIIYQSYKTWLIAMLSKNKKEILQYTEDMAKVLVNYANEGTKTDKRNFVRDKLLQYSVKINFLNALEVLLKDIGEENKPKIKQLRDDAYLMNDEECKYLITLLKFDFSYLNK